ncbi:alcohol dehydrogenase catalytic domain-containing protein [Nesterenkonia sp. NBAIMH1]|uniref:alcohol dehydrogenase catalytic domain-containing protein n=1 Tax=Nesterenkonia sp. NBAIMH1 TaxID=2600320 RepID=UPI0011B53BA0|nr:alcohol dehydrogenase catalytic domain-containing protein [Nesterenkonia sp. NBAIMH1]
MKAVTWQGTHKMSVETVPDPTIEKPSDAVIEVTSTAICGSDLHLYEVLGPFMTPGDIVGHEPMGRVVETGSGTDLKVGDRVVVPFQIACGNCYFCSKGLQTQCETTQNTDMGTGAPLFGYSQLYGAIPGGQAQFLRVPHADYGPIKVGDELPDHRYLFLSDVLPTAWQAVQYAGVKKGDSVAVLGLGPIGQFCARIARHLGMTVYAIEPEAERREMAARHGIEVFPQTEDAVATIKEKTQGRGPDAVIDAVGMEAHGGVQSAVAKFAQLGAQFMPKKISQPMMDTVGMDRLGAVYTAIDLVRRGGTISLSGVYGGQASPLPMLTMFDKQIRVTMGQANVKNWVDDILPLVEDTKDPLGVDDFVTHHLPLDQAPEAYQTFQKKEDGCIKVVLDPQAS